jgi:hypothetical protein
VAQHHRPTIKRLTTTHPTRQPGPRQERLGRPAVHSHPPPARIKIKNSTHQHRVYRWNQAKPSDPMYRKTCLGIRPPWGGACTVGSVSQSKRLVTKPQSSIECLSALQPASAGVRLRVVGRSRSAARSVAKPTRLVLHPVFAWSRRHGCFDCSAWKCGVGVRTSVLLPCLAATVSQVTASTGGPYPPQLAIGPFRADLCARYCTHLVRFHVCAGQMVPPAGFEHAGSRLAGWSGRISPRGY